MMTPNENFIATLGLVTVAFGAAVAIPNIGDAMTIIGATSNPFVGFSLPIFFYLKLDKSHKCSPHRLFAHLVNIIVLLVGALSLSLFIIRKTHPEMLQTEQAS